MALADGAVLVVVLVVPVVAVVAGRTAEPLLAVPPEVEPPHAANAREASTPSQIAAARSVVVFGVVTVLRSSGSVAPGSGDGKYCGWTAAARSLP